MRSSLPTTAWCVAAACAAVLMWIGAEADERGHAFSFTGHKRDYYSLLVAGFAKGHLYMDVEADPRLSSADQNIRDKTPTLLDANYFQGHFYLYYGVVPAALLLLPYHILTGQDLGTNAACLVFIYVGFVASLFWLRAFWRDFCPPGGAGLSAILVVVLAFFPATAFLVRRSMFYELPLAAGYACVAVFLACLYEVVQGRRLGAMLAAASTSAGLAVGCHPNHILLVPVLGAVAWAALRGPRGAPPVSAVRLACAALGPAAAIGAALAAYNYGRFGSLVEFGFKYGQNGFFAVKQSVFVPKFLWTNFKWYFLTPPALTPYFPFVFPGNNTFRPAGYQGAEAMHGQLVALLLFLWVAVGAAATRRQRSFPVSLRRFAWVLGYCVFAALLFIGCLQIRANRYMTDFATPLAWLMAGWGAWVWTRMGPGFPSALWKAGFTTLALLGALFYSLASIQQFDQFRNTRPASQAALSDALNIPYGWLYRMGMTPPGLLSLKVRFQPRTEPVVEPLVTTGTPGYSDSVYVAQFPDHRVQFSFNHKGYGGPSSELLPIDLSREHAIEISMGSFYPPLTDRYLPAFGRQSARLLKDLAYLTLDGKVILSATMAFYESPPWARETGANTTTLAEFKPEFTGTLHVARTVAVGPLLDQLNRTAKWGILQYRVKFPSTPPLSGLPLLGLGEQGDGNLVFAKAQAGGTYRVELDDWAYGVQLGQSFTPTPGEHTLQFVVGPLLMKAAVPAAWESGGDLTGLRDRVVVSLDHTVLGVFRLVHHLSQAEALTPGANPQGFSTAEPMFGEYFNAFPMTDGEVQGCLREASMASRP